MRKLIKVKYYGSYKELQNAARDRESRTWIYSESMFDILHDGDDPYVQKPPFRDDVSRMFLRESYGIELVEDDWFSIMEYGRRDCFRDLAKDMKYALVLLDTSRRGIFLSAHWMADRVWDAVMKAPFDILIACTWQDICGTGRYSRALPYRDYLILNYPWQGGTEVYVVSPGVVRGEGYTKVDPDCYGSLYTGPDGRYYSDDMYGADLRFRWWRHLDQMVDQIDKMQQNSLSGWPRKLKTIEDSYSIPEFAALLGIDEGEVRYFISWNEETRRNWDDFRIVNHMYALPPEDTIYRTIPILSVQRDPDGRCKVIRDISFHYPTYREIVESAAFDCSPDHETLLLYVNVPDEIDGPEDLNETIWAVLCRSDSIELFDKWDGLEMFADWVREGGEI